MKQVSVNVNVDASTFIRLSKEAERLGIGIEKLAGQLVDIFFARRVVRTRAKIAKKAC